MAIKLKIPRRSSGGKGRWISPRTIKVLVATFVILTTIVIGVFTHFYLKYEKVIDRRMSGTIFSNSAKIYAQPRPVRVGQKLKLEDMATELRRAGYTEQGSNLKSQIGRFRLLSNAIEVQPGPESFHTPEPATIYVVDGKVTRITAEGGGKISEYELEPKLVTALFDSGQRAKRQLVKFNEIPKVLVDAVLAIEDRRFFEHSGVNYFRLAQVVWIDLMSRQHKQGASTLTMQMARAFFLTPEKTLKRKLIEILIAFELEQKFTKQQIFELYANQVDLGQRGSFTIVGFAEAARAYFNKDLGSITVPEAALIAAIIQRPSYLNPYRHPQRALHRRNMVLDAMVETGKLTREGADRFKAAPLNLAPPNVEASDAPYFVDLVREQVAQTDISEEDLNAKGYRIYTTLDPELQQAAAEAVTEGMKLVDAQVEKLRTRKKKVGKGKDAKVETTVAPGPLPQVALVALDPQTGEVLALVGGRNYGFSQLNHAVAKRPTGSIFKPFVYAAAMNATIGGDGPPVTPVSLIDDNPTTFMHGDEIYEPRNYKGEYHGQVTARYALALSLNNATVRLAETVGYDRVVELARASGIRSVRATPAMALGAYDATPLEMAGAYTVFANEGTRVTPLMVKSVRDSAGNVVQDFTADKRPVLDPRVAYVLTNMMSGVLNFGTGYEVRKRGFTAPAAGKTGSSHDAWFAGYTSNLICVVWVGYDDYSDLRLSGGVVAAPIWAEFMKRAVKLPQYSDTKGFQQPSGVVDVRIDKTTNLLATDHCATDTINVAFIAGTEPTQTCDQAFADQRGFFQKLFGVGEAQAQPPPQPNVRTLPANTPRAPSEPGLTQQQAQQQEKPEPEKKKKGFWGRIFGGGDDDKDKKNKQ